MIPSATASATPKADTYVPFHSQTRKKATQSKHHDTIPMPSMSTRRATAPPCGGDTTLQESMPELASQATAPSGGETITLQQFFPTIYKKKKSKSKKAFKTQQMDFPSNFDSSEVQDTSDEMQQQDDTIHITASEGVPAWMYSATTSSIPGRKRTVTVPRDAAKYLLQYLSMAMGTSAQEFEVPVQELGARPRTDSKRGMQIPETPMPTPMASTTEGAAAWSQIPSTIPSYMQVPMEMPMPREETLTIDWTNIRK